MPKKLFFMLFIIFPVFLFAQTRSRLAILPFAGGTGGEGELIATLFSGQSDIMEKFTVVPRTAAVNALVAEQNFQLSGYTDSDTIAGIGRMLNADFVVSGHIRSLGTRSLVIATIINVETFEQLAGAYREYRTAGEIPALLPGIARRLIDATGRDTTELPKLAVAPFNITSEEVDEQDAEVLAQILAIEVANTGEYAVLPRTSTMQAAMRELEFQMSGATAEESAKALGRAINAEYILSGQVGNIGSTNLFTAQILNVESGILIMSGSRNYSEIGDGMLMMEELALLLTDKEAAAALIRLRRKQEAIRDLFANPARLWTAGVSVGSAFPEPLLNFTARGTVAPIKYCFLELGFDYGLISTHKDVEKYSSMCFYGNLAGYVPIKKIGIYAGAGCGFQVTNITWDSSLHLSDNKTKAFAINYIAGINLFDIVDLSFTWRSSEWNSNDKRFDDNRIKVSAGYTYRFR